MNLSDEELQSRIESGEKITSRDGEIYNRLFETLSKSPGDLHAGFADRVMDRVESHSQVRDFVWLILGIVMFVIAALITVIKAQWSFPLQYFKFPVSYTGLFIFALFFIIGLHVVDRKWIHKEGRL